MYLGADPELFVTKEGKVIPASDAGLLDGKHHLDRRELFDEIQIYRDGYAAEVNFLRPFACRGTMGNILSSGLYTFLKARQDDGLGLSTLPSVPVDLDDLKRLPQDVSAFGCSPSMQAWEDGMPSYMEIEALKHPWRYAGGHLWFSAAKGYDWWTDNLLESVKLLDLHVGVPFSWLFSRPEQFKRREVYGKAGEFRLKDFEGGFHQGLEYRTLGPEWLNHAAFFSLAFGIARQTLRQGKELWSKHKEFIEGEGKDLIPAAINTGVGLDELMEVLTFEPYISKGLMKRLRDDSKLGEERFDFKLFDTEDFHYGWFTVLNQTGIKPNNFGPDAEI